MGRAPCCDKANVKRGPWSPDEDAALRTYLETHGMGGNWIALPKKAGLRRCGKSCRLRWLNYLRPDIKHGGFTEEEDNLIFSLYHEIGSRWSIISSQLPGRTDNDVKNYWNTKLKKKLLAGKTNPPATANAMMNHISSTTVGSGNDLLQAGLHYYGHGSSPSEAQSFTTFPTSLDVHYGSLNVKSFGVKSETIGSISSEFSSNNMNSSISQECSSITSSSSPSLVIDNGLISFPGNGGAGSSGAHSDLHFEFPWDIIIDELLSDDASIDQSFADLTFTDEINPADQKLNQTSFGYQY